MEHECYVSLEVAKLLKKAGFDWPTRYSYDLPLYSTEGEKRVVDGFASTFCNEHNGLASMPTLEVAQRWLREVKGVAVNVMSNVIIDIGYKWYLRLVDMKQMDVWHEDFHESYEEALEAGIKKALEIILENKNYEFITSPRVS